MLTASVDRKIIENYGDYINPEKKNLKIEDITHFQAEKEFKKRYKGILLKENPDLPEDVLEAEANSLAGYVDSNGKVYVNESKRGHYNTLLHEKIHHVSAKELRDQMGIGMDEGMTEYFARKSGANEVFEKDIDLVFDPQTHRLVKIEDRTPHYYELESPKF